MRVYVFRAFSFSGWHEVPRSILSNHRSGMLRITR